MSAGARGASCLRRERHSAKIPVVLMSWFARSSFLLVLLESGWTRLWSEMPGVGWAQSWRRCLVRCSDCLHAWPRGSRESLWALAWFAGSLPPVPEPPLPCHAFLSPRSSLRTGSCDGAIPRINRTVVATWWVAQSLAVRLAVSTGGLRVSLSLATCAWCWDRLSSLPLAFVSPLSRCGGLACCKPKTGGARFWLSQHSPHRRWETSVRVGLFWWTKIRLNPSRSCLEMVSLKAGCWVTLCVLPSKCQCINTSVFAESLAKYSGLQC